MRLYKVSLRDPDSVFVDDDTTVFVEAENVEGVGRVLNDSENDAYIGENAVARHVRLVHDAGEGNRAVLS